MKPDEPREIDPEEKRSPAWPVEGAPPDADTRLVEALRAGDAEAGRCFVQEQYPRVYRYLLYLAGAPELAQDLTQETFLQAWRRLDTFAGRAPLKAWLHTIAHRVFLHTLRRRRLQASLEEVGEVAAPHPAAWTEAIEAHALIGTLSEEEREILLLHHLEGYTSGEIARIVGAPEGTVRYRLSQAHNRRAGYCPSVASLRNRYKRVECVAVARCPSPRRL
jgi:RNA polymerase sigma-70 factor (ECF subfamily)